MKHIHSTISILDQSEIELIHKSTLEVLWKTGCRFPHSRVLDLLESRGASVDRATKIARLPPDLIEKALSDARPTLKESYQPLFSSRKYSIHPGNEANIIDFKAISRRLGTTEDVIKGIVLCNELQYINDVMPLVTPADMPGYMGDLYGYYLCTLYSKKPYSVYICSPESARQIIKMWELVKNEPSRVNFSPHVGFLLEPNGALSYDSSSLEMAMIFSEAGHQIWLGPMAMAGLDAPVTLAGTLLMQNAYNLSGIVFCWLLGYPGGWGGGAHTVDLRTLLCSFGSPNQVLIALAAIQLAHFYGYEVSVNSGLTDACLPDFQCGFEKGMTGIVATLAGGNIGAMGIVGADQGTSFEQLVIDNEWASAFDHIISHGVEVNKETLAVDVIQRVGVGGSFIADEHTVRHARQTYWKAGLFNQASWDAWMADGGKDVYQKAHEVVVTLLEKHYPPQLQVSEKIVHHLDQILDDAKEHPTRFTI